MDKAVEILGWFLEAVDLVSVLSTHTQRPHKSSSASNHEYPVPAWHGVPPEFSRWWMYEGLKASRSRW